MKKMISILLSLLLVLALTVTGLAADGTFQGEGAGKGGMIQVEVTVENGEIAAINVLSHGETPGFSDALGTVSAAMIAANQVDVDGVTGATLSSNGIKAAVTAALAAADITPDQLTAKEVAEVVSDRESAYTADVIVIGAGGAGLSAAITAAENGASVILVEKMSNVGVNTLISGGEMAAPGSWMQEKEGIADDVETFYNDVLKGGDNEGDPALIRVLAENALNGALWLRDEINVTFEDYMLFFGGHSIKRSLVPLNASGVELIQKLNAKAEAMGVTIHKNTRATKLVMTDGKVTTVVADFDGQEITYTANKGVILTTGGFGSNIEMRKQYNPKMDEKILSTNSVGSTGDGVVMAQELGAQVVDMQYIQTYPTCDVETGALLYVGDVRLEGRSILVNLEGKRFVEELERRDVISFAVTEQTGGVSYMFWDEASMQASGVAASHQQEYDDLIRRGKLVKADTMEEACAHFGINAEELKATVERYNQYAADGKDLEFNKRGTLTAFGEGPYYIMVSTPAIHHCMGGLKINTSAQVMDTEGNVIPGLYAAGEVTGDIHGTNRLGSDAIADIIVYGRIAGENAAAGK